MFSVCYILTQHMSALEIFYDSVLYKCSLNNNNNLERPLRTRDMKRLVEHILQI